MSDNRNSQHNIDIIDVLKHSEDNEKEKQDLIATLEMYNGPIPHPDILSGYDKLDPGSAKRIIDNGIGESHHRRKIEEKTINHIIRSFYFRFTLAFILAILFGLASFYLILKGHTIVGSIFVSFTFISMIGIFTGENKSNNYNDKK